MIFSKAGLVTDQIFMSNNIPNHSFALIIGAMKCGTTFLYDHLVSHPAVCPCSTKEPEFFSENQGHRTPEKDYKTLWQYRPQVHRVALEASTGYTKYPYTGPVAKKIYNYGLEPKFIYLVRDPFERISSHYNFMKSNPDFDLTMSLTDDRLVNLSRYYFQLSQYLDYFPQQTQYLVIDSARLFTHPKEILLQVQQFLDLETVYRPELFEAKNQTHQLTALELSLHRTKLINISGFVPKPVRRLIKRSVKRYSVNVEKRVFTEQEKSFVYERLWQDMKQLKYVFNVNVAAWGFLV